MGEKKNGFLEKIRAIRREQWIVLLLAGILAVVISLPVSTGEKSVSAVQQTKETVSAGGQESVLEIESRLERILSQMDGAGKVKVMITQKDDGEKIVEKDAPASESTVTEESGAEVTRNTQEKSFDEQTVYEKNGDGSQIPYVRQNLAPRIEGVLVLAQGGDNAVVEKNITDAVKALFGLDAHKIKVMKMIERRG